MTADEELDYYISPATIRVDKENNIIDQQVPARYRGENVIVEREKN